MSLWRALGGAHSRGVLCEPRRNVGADDGKNARVSTLASVPEGEAYWLFGGLKSAWVVCRVRAECDKPLPGLGLLFVVLEVAGLSDVICPRKGDYGGLAGFLLLF